MAYFDMIKNGIKAVIKDKTLHKDLVSIIKDSNASTKEEIFRYLPLTLDLLYNNLLSLGIEKPKKTKSYKLLNDMVQCITYLADNCDTVNSMVKYLEDIFDDTATEKKVELRTIHGSKGLEAENVWLINKSDIGKERNGKVGKDEVNILFVAISRAKNNLYYVNKYFGKGSDEFSVEGEVSLEY
jgi:superfamily I DNA/RNA helicase